MHQLASNSHCTTAAYAIKPKEGVHLSNQLARDHLKAAQRHQKGYYDQEAHGAPIQSEKKVWFHVSTPQLGVPQKIHRPWAGPHQIIRTHDDTT